MGHGLSRFLNPQLSQLILWSYMTALVLTGLLITALQAERLRMEDRLRDREARLRGLYEMSPLGIALTDMQGHFLEFNDAFLAMSGYSAEELTRLDYWALTPRSYEAGEAQQLESLERTGRYGPYEKEYVRKDGRLVSIRLNGMLMKLPDGQSSIWSIAEDITARKRIETDLKIAATAFDSREAMIVTDAHETILRVNQAFTEITGYTAEEAVGKTPRLFRSGRHSHAFYQEMWDSIHQTGGWQGEVWDRRKNGTEYPKWLTISAVRGDDGAVTHYIGTHLDITERKRAEEKIQELAFFDQLTGLPNRTLLMDRLKQAMTASARNEGHGALLFIDLDHFKTLNDTLGHDKGDLLLKQVAQRLTACIREGDTVARLGGDEFVVVLPGLSPTLGEAARATELVGEKIVETLNTGYQLDRLPYKSTASVGATLFMGKDTTIDDLMKQADLAMYRAKESGRNALRFFDPDMESAVINRVALEKGLREAIEQQQFFLHYQAQVLENGELTGAEVLVRWQHPGKGTVSPAEFIPLAEETGLILPLGQWVMQTACAQLAQWAKDPTMARLMIAVNVSPRQFRQADFVDQVIEVIGRTGANPERLKLELTEGLLVENPEEVAQKMAALKARGVGFALDDFGTGYSSLSYLKRMPFDLLKIDQSFVRDVLSDPNDAAIARTIVALAESLGLGVLAEGVETAAQRDFLAHIGCHAFQGYFFSRPVPVEEFEMLVRKGGAPPQGCGREA
jgi:diguanylate cyclase (GGDEF)-like protein/PAS domain S-box-containing protein